MAAALWASSLLGQTAPAQTEPADPDTLVFGKRSQPDMPNFFLAPVHGQLDLRGTWVNTNTSSDAAGDSHTRDRLFEETLTLYTNGYIIHPNMVELHLSVTGGLSQAEFSDDTTSGSANGTVYGWDVSAVILRNQPANLTLYSRRTEGTTDVPFGPTLRTTSTVYGATLNYRTTDTTMSLDAYHQEDTQSSFGAGQPGFSETRDVLNANGQTQLTADQTLTWNLTLQQARFDNGGDSVTERTIGGSVAHNVNFGDDRRSSLSSGVTYSKTNDNIDIEDFRWNEHLHLQHTPNFETNYDYTYEQLTYGSTTTEHQSAYMDARHQLYKSLTTIGRIHWDDVSGDGQEVQTYGADLDMNYRKTTPNGILFADTHLGYQEQDISGSGEIAVPVQPVSFTGLDPITIAQSNVVPGSIIIRDAATGRAYVQGVDYTLNPTPTGMEVDRVLGGNIVPGQPLLMSYLYDPEDASQINTTTFGAGTRYQFTKGPLTGLTPYAKFFGQEQSISGGNAQPNNLRDYTLGAYYRYKDLTLKAEREWLESDLYPYDAWRYEARWDHRFSSDTSGSVGITYADMQYHDPEQETKTLSLNASVSQRITTHLNVSVYAAYANADSSPGGKTQGLEEGLEANWTQQDTKIYVRVRNSSLNMDSTDQNFQFFQIGLTRTF